MPVSNRWLMAVAGVFLQMALGAAYAWSVFRIPLSHEFGWTITQITWVFLISWFFLGCTATVGGMWMKRVGPKVVAMTAGLLWGGGVFLASMSANRLWWMYLSYGVIGGIGLGMGYIVPITVLVKWFPDRRGLITGIAVAGFGAGALFSAPAAGWLIQRVGLMPTFAYLGVAYGVIAIAAGSFMKNPPEGWTPAGWTPSAKHISQRADRDYTLGQALATWQWWALSALMSINTMAGLSIVTQASPIF
jgi:OFA family oxalate/formate antiporter-like MFS transporter